MKLMKMSYNNKKKKQIILAMLNKQKNNAFLQMLKKKIIKSNNITIEYGHFSIYTYPAHIEL